LAQSSAKLQDPSMEEILASIRRIISDENAVAEASLKPAHVPLREVKAEPPASAEDPISQDAVDELLSPEDAPPAAHEPAVLELTETVEIAAPSGGRFLDAADVVFRDQDEPAQAAPEPPALSAQLHTPDRAAVDTIISQETSAAVSAAFDSLAHTFFAQNARTVDDLVREMLRPMLKHWLDDNLPGLVERMVRSEIERVSRGGR
jgi:cell pole-organizing protein PopZ